MVATNVDHIETDQSILRYHYSMITSEAGIDYAETVQTKLVYFSSLIVCTVDHIETDQFILGTISRKSVPLELDMVYS